jgi:GT2 family glycosyltransferase
MSCEGEKNMKTMIAIPCMDMMHTRFVQSLIGMQVTGEIQYNFGMSSLVYDSRNKMASMAIDGGFDRVLWLDSDMVFEPDTFTRLSLHMEMGRKFVSALCVKRKHPVNVTIYKSMMLMEENGIRVPKAYTFTDYPKDSLFEVAAAGFGCVMTDVQLLRDVMEKFGLPFSPVLGFGEDLSFCQRAREIGTSLYCDSSIKTGHIGFREFTEADIEEEKT